MRDGLKETARLRMALSDVMDLAVDAAVDCVNDAVAASEFGVLKEGGGDEAFAVGEERNLDGVVHTSGEDGFDGTALWTSAENVRGARGESGTVGNFVSLFGEGSLGPVDPSVGTFVGAVEVIGASGKGLGVEPDFSRVRDTVVVRVGELPDHGRGGDIDARTGPENAFREHELIGEDGTPIVDAVVVVVYQAKNAVGLLGELLFDRVIGTGRLRDIEAPLVVLVDDHRPLNKGRGGRDLKFEALGNGELSKRVRARRAGYRQQRDQQEERPHWGIVGRPSEPTHEVLPVAASHSPAAQGLTDAVDLLAVVDKLLDADEVGGIATGIASEAVGFFVAMDRVLKALQGEVR